MLIWTLPLNKKIKIIPFQIEHLDWMDIREHEVENILCTSGYKERVKALSEEGVALTIMYANIILCVLGVFDLYKGVCEIWMLPCNSIQEHKLSFAKATKHLLNQLWETDYYNRIQITALADDFHNKYFLWLGFKLETPNGMKNFTIKKCTYNMWSRTK